MVMIAVLIVIGIVVLLAIAFGVRRARKRDIRMKQKEGYLSGIAPLPDLDRVPNIVIVLCDDLGYEDISCFGAKIIHTPNIDALAENGIKCTSFYASAPVCSPSRAGLLTGRLPVRAHVPSVFFPSHTLVNLFFSIFTYSYGMNGIAQDEILLPEILKRAGYATGMIGKWHLGDRSPHLPNDLGFDYFFGAHYSNDMSPYHIWHNKSIAIKASDVVQDDLTKILNEQAIGFIKDHAKVPFLLYYAEPLPHHPLHASAEFRGKSQAGLYGDAVQEIDWSVGKIVQELKDQGIFENTLFIFTSDNGPWHEGNPGYHRGRKRLPFDGGMKVPMVACWPQKIAPQQSTDAVMSNMDIVPTILALLGIPLPEDRIIDGCDVTDIVKNGSTTSPHDAIYYFFDKQLQAVRMGNWKYHIKHTSDNSGYIILKPGPFLFDLATDPNESYDQITHFPDQAKKLADNLDKMRQSLKHNLRGWSR